MSDDERLLEAWRAGDKRAGQELFHRHAEIVRRFVINKVDATGAEAEDLIQQTFLACVEGRDRFEGRASFRAYLLGIARNLVRKHWEVRRIRGRTEDIDEVAIAELTSSPSSVAARNQQERCLLEALRRVSLRDQTVLELAYWEDLSAREIGEVLGIPTDTVQSRIRRARDKLNKEVARMVGLLGVPESTDEDLAGWAEGVRRRLAGGTG
ncbi:MAG: sigma-70 family RNA polymerase sigma factor [Enhygromyxa sp.]